MTINGKKLNSEFKEGTYFTVSRNWKKGNVLEYTMPMNIYKETLPDDQNKVGLLYEPVVLAGKLGAPAVKKTDISVFVNNNNQAKDWIQFANKKTITFTTKVNQSSKLTTLVPLYDIADDKYMIYWDKFSTDEWQHKK